MKASAVIPAYNEAERIKRVLNAVASSASVDQIIVVDDGSRDRTAAVAAQHNGAVVVRLAQNQGKAAAMAAGVRRARNQVVVFLDADLVGLTDHHVDDLVAPVLRGEADMTVGQFQGGRGWITLWQRLVPAISGQRAMRAADFMGVPNLEGAGFGVELAISRHAARRRLRTRLVYLPEMTHVIKEEKRGLLRGLRDRIVMYAQMLRSALGNGYHHLQETAEERDRG